MESLITTLRGAVSNNALPKLGELHIHINDTSSDIVRFNFRSAYGNLANIRARITGDSYFTNADGSQNLGKTFSGSAGSTADFRVAPGECDLFINFKDEIILLLVNNNSLNQSGVLRAEFDFGELKYQGSTIVTSLVLTDTGCYGDVSKPNTLKCSQLALGGCVNLYGDITELVTNSPFSGGVQNGNLEIKDTLITMDLAALSGKSAITNFNGSDYLRGDIKYLADIADTTIRNKGNNAITGSIEEFVSRAQSNGKSIGTITFSFNPKSFINVTFEGVSLTDNANVPNKTGAKFTWDAQGNVTWS